MEPQHSEKLGVSHLGIREAPKSLEFLGMIELKTGVGLTVGRIDMERLNEHLGFHSRLAELDPQQLIDSRVIVDTGVLSHVTRKIAKYPAIGTELYALADFGTPTLRATRSDCHDPCYCHH